VLSIEEAIEYQNKSAQTKEASSRKLGSYSVSSMLAGTHIGIGVVLMCAAAGPFLQADNPASKLVSGLVFGVALTLVVVAGGELLTSNMMTLTQGAYNKAISWGKWARTITLCFTGNFVGSVIFALFVHLSHIFKEGSAPLAYLEYTVTSKASATPIQVFFKGILCNIIVCLAIWGGVRLKSEGAKMFLIFWCALAFITSGFEHVVANMTSFSLALMAGVEGIGAADFAINIVASGLGNLVGGGVVIGIGYSVLATNRTVQAPADNSRELSSQNV
jgi:nitrite transporter NirC